MKIIYILILYCLSKVFLVVYAKKNLGLMKAEVENIEFNQYLRRAKSKNPLTQAGVGDSKLPANTNPLMQGQAIINPTQQVPYSGTIPGQQMPLPAGTIPQSTIPGQQMPPTAGTVPQASIPGQQIPPTAGTVPQASIPGQQIPPISGAVPQASIPCQQIPPIAGTIPQATIPGQQIPPTAGTIPQATVPGQQISPTAGTIPGQQIPPKVGTIPLGQIPQNVQTTAMIPGAVAPNIGNAAIKTLPLTTVNQKSSIVPSQQFPGIPNLNQKAQPSLGSDQEYEEILEEITTPGTPQQFQNQVQNPIRNNIPGQAIQPQNGQAYAQQQNQGMLYGSANGVIIKGQTMATQNPIYNNKRPIAIQYTNANNRGNYSNNNRKSNSFIGLVTITPLGLKNSNNSKDNSQSCCESKLRSCQNMCELRGGVDECLVNVDVTYDNSSGFENTKHLQDACICKESRHKYNIITHNLRKK